MDRDDWKRIALAEPEENLWSLYHENSKSTSYQHAPSVEQVKKRLGQLHEALPYRGYPRTSLPPPARCAMSLDAALSARRSERSLVPGPLPLATVAAILRAGYGPTHAGNPLRTFRAAPSAGGLLPLELYLYTESVPELASGLYHYHPIENAVRQLGPVQGSLDRFFVLPKLNATGSMFIFITALFERTMFKYGERGYRFILLETGHVAQNMNLAATALGLGVVNIGAFYEREVDPWLGLDGVTQSTLYVLAFGHPAPRLATAGP